MNDKSPTRPAFHGLALVIVQDFQQGNVIVTAASDCLLGDFAGDSAGGGAL